MLKDLAKKSGDAVVIHYVSLDDLEDTFLIGNSKKHDVSKLIESIRRYGFRDPIAFDSTLNNGSGGIIEGNGRLEALVEMRSQNMNLPRGIQKDAGASRRSGERRIGKADWLVPVLFGVDATNEAEAVSFSVEHNWSVLWGVEDIDLEFATSMFDDEALKEQLEWLDAENNLPLSIDDNLDELLGNLNTDGDDTEKIPNADDEGSDYSQTFAIAIECKSEEEQEATFNLLSEQGYKCKVLTV